MNFDFVLIGRFGFKAQEAGLEDFIRGPLFNHLGITTEPLSFGPPSGGLSVEQQVSSPEEPTEDEDEIEDHFWIKKIEPGKLWLEPLTIHDGVIGPVPVPKKVTQICGEMWDISGVVVKTRRGWRLLEVWKVTP